ncbi:hypothetical protein BJ165DRAFT_1512408 [Panaeolus papilionaceus]|nr:hypothetical protein BJ165DRAFT_1512408 [Panaeolus papilionaceus]
MDSFITSTLQKHLFREMKLSDKAVKNPGVLRWNGLSRQNAGTATTSSAAGKKSNVDDEEDETAAPTTFGVGQSTPSTAMTTTQQPDDLPLSCNHLNRAGYTTPIQQEDHLIVQAILTKYHKLWGATAVGVWEVGCNFGRTFHQFGCIGVG